MDGYYIQNKLMIYKYHIDFSGFFMFNQTTAHFKNVTFKV